ncbi:MAG: hypothetical protein OEU91_03825 [Gammaproteobacteria bacterium]|nr:hypothetical protein [Gammaproteobacteria bacterium]
MMVASSRGELYERFLDTIRDRYGTQNDVHLSTIYLDREARTLTEIDETTDLLLTVGTRAASTVAELGLPIPAINAIIPESSYRTLIGSETGCSKRSAIFIDQPLRRQALLASHIFPNARNYGVLLGPVSRQRRVEIDTMELPADRRLIVRNVTQEENTVATTRKLLKETDLLLAVNDPLVLNRENAKLLLYAAYQKQIPIIGFSRAYVRAGAAAAVFSEPEQMAKQAMEMIKHWRSRNSSCLPGPEYTRYFRVAINTGVARSLGGDDKDEDTLIKMILKQEQRQ